MISSVLIINRVIYCAKDGDDSTHKAQSCQHLYTPFLFGLAFETILFFLFTGKRDFGGFHFYNPFISCLDLIRLYLRFNPVCMMFEQIETIRSGTSKIARMKLRQGGNMNESPVIGEFNEMFGGDHPGLSWHWFIPVPVVFPPQYKDEIMGYEYHHSWHGEIYIEDENPEQDPESESNTNTTIDLENGNVKEITVKKRPSSRLELEDESNLI